ncbi:biopolymer transport protein ExbB [Advenella mimigardefordensis DPN7]|uniref:Biopolymer transport protein ExbB n=2 Tax=Advenella mimigardefordensis TaxID=302406 RepID=W0PIL2_ADVMD|nr:biopolymer transport protein ExbB [Advenella mimigardefordensis DPN7]
MQRLSSTPLSVLTGFISMCVTGAHAQALTGLHNPDVQQGMQLTLQQPASVLNGEFSPMGIYEAAHPVVQGVIIVLLLCSLLTWTICVVKAAQLALATHRIRRQQRWLSDIPSLALCRDVAGHWRRTHEMPLLVREITDEITLSSGVIDTDLKDRIEYRLARRADQQLQRLRYGIGPLATIGSVAPFVGLFGTVWGIMNSFIGIASAKNVSLAVVAPGIAEALFATAIGLVAAIPAVVLYNLFLRGLNRYQAQLGNLVAMLFLLFKRDVSLGRSVLDREQAEALRSEALR